jgi:glyoxylase-like metal-dependent hydrolase (beta-lactamase superfamily II)
MIFVCVTAYAQAPPSLCTTAVPPPPPAPGRGGGGGGAPQAGRGGQPAQPAAAPAELPRLVKVKDDVYVIKNANDTEAEIGPFGGNVAIYLTDDGVILFDSKNDRMHDDIVAKVRSLTDKPIKYVVLSHNHGDHAGGSARMVAIGATVIMSVEDREQLARANQPGLPQVAYHGQAQVFLGGKEVRLREFCGHTRGDTVALLPGPRVLLVGDLVTMTENIPPIVSYGDGGNWIDRGKTLDELANMDFDLVVGGHGPVLTKQEFLKRRDQVAAISERLRTLNRQGRSQEEITRTLVKEFNFGNGIAGAQIAPMMSELK